MVDKLDVKNEADAPFARELANVGKQLRQGAVYPFRPSRRYTYVGDLREAFGIDAILHLGFRGARGQNPLHTSASKLEIIDAGKKSIHEMSLLIARVFDVDPASCKLMRLDLAADIVGVPVHIFRDCARFQYKQFASSIAKCRETELEFTAMGTADAQTLYAGRRPNLIRIYNKIRELYAQWLKKKRDCERFNRKMRLFELSAEQRYYGMRVCPTFEEFCLGEGYSSIQDTVTRVERQMQGANFPDELQLFGDLNRVHLFNPFESMQIVPTGTISSFDSPPSDVSVRDWLAVMGFDALKKNLGSAQQAYSFVQKHGKGNGKRILDSLSGILPAERPPMTLDEVRASFVRTVEIQQGQRPGIGHILTP